MADGVEALSSASGLSRESVHEIWEEVKANHARLEGCVGPHDFGPKVEKIRARYTCRKCGGTVDAVARNWYERGLAHGRM